MSAAKVPNPKAKFVTGSTMRHVITMTVTGSVGLLGLFLVDFANLYYISLLGEAELAAAIGFAGTLVFFNISISIGIMIAAGALVSRSLGEENRDQARSRAGTAMVMSFILLSMVSAATYIFIPELLTLIGAKGEALAVATHFLEIVVPSLPIMGIGMTASGSLRAAGDGRRSMFVTLIAGVVTAVLDPFLIFGLDMGVTGAAVASVISRFIMAFLGLYWAAKVHNLVGLPDPKHFREDFKALLGIAIPAILTNVATPVGNAWVTASMAPYGDDAVAGWAVVGRLIPISFAAFFALSGAVGPIFGQNLGAKQYDRVRRVLVDSLIFMTVYTLVIWAVLALLAEVIADAFQSTGDMRDLIIFFCTIVAGTGIFQGMMFVANAAFNNLGFPTYSTIINWGRSTLGTIPFVWVGAQIAGAKGVMLGQFLGVAMFGIVAIILCFRVIGKLDGAPPSAGLKPPVWSSGLNPFSSGKSASVG